ncbi:acetyl-CoA carboxylase, biotin carboxyl carrier protein [Vulcanibacillus modesticaldus]|uniref:Biotin carboxyl carrier protein of acetyl-CoA carboxylase n=1 Tax=Vulcanibacillus modesticaldus TaxID=337097 RepID=A0A1D2YRT1_9BACI|nr:acetyl-CoA carboxylase biotin carboxyl carrier protein [Vulcanibacillus modesticaldus]OEF95515.1 acetyl-CoA carboxylase, biotin carboxyl carrier protein [Vulcanibacillus modesticaldus]
MFKIHELREIIRLIDKSNIHTFELEHEGSKITLKKQSPEKILTTVSPQPVQPTFSQEHATAIAQTEADIQQQHEQNSKPNKSEVENKNFHQIKSPMVGTFYKAPSPDSDPFVRVGDKINENTVVCIVEAMKLFNEIEAEVKGEIMEVLVEDGQLVEYGQPLFLVKVD